MSDLKTKFKFDDTKFKAKCAKLGKEWGFMGHAVLADQMRLLANDVLKNSPPGADKRGDYGKQINKECRRIFQGMNKEGTIELLQHIVARGAKGKKLQAALQAKYDGTGAEFNMRGDSQSMNAWHSQHRGKNGVVHHTVRKVGEVFRGRNGSGSFPIWNKMYVPTRKLEQFIRKRVAHIGILMGGSIPAIKFFENLTKATSRGAIPAWVRKAWAYAPQTWGRGEDSFDRGTLKGNMSMMHGVPWNGMLEFVIAKSLGKRQADVENHLHKRMDQLVRRWKNT